jgi:1-acyl-sn-glycerol-3-phosphate acyltransferase
MGLTPGERYRSLAREAGTGEWLAQQAAWLAAGVWLRGALRLTVEGREHVPAQPPFLLVSNHTSHLDALVLGSLLPARLRSSAFPIAAGDTFFHTPAVAALSAILLNALPMWRKSCGPHSLALLRARLMDDPCVFIVFPEGTRARDGRLGPFRAGIGRVIAGTPVPVVPCRIEGAFEAWPPQRRLPHRGRVVVRAGPPLHFHDVPDDRSGWERVAAAAQRAVAAL